MTACAFTKCFHPRGLPQDRGVVRLAWYGALIAGLFGSPADVRAAEWSINGGIRQVFQYDDNVRLRTTDPDWDWGGTLSSRIGLHRRSQTLDVKLDGRLDFTRFAHDENLNSDDQFAILESRYDTELGAWHLDARVSRESTRTSEVTDTGAFQIDATRLAYSINPFWSYNVSPRDNFKANFNYTEVRYDTGTLTEYRYYKATARWDRRVTEVDDIDLLLSGSRYETLERDGRQQHALGAEVGYRHSFSEQLKVRGAGGVSFVSQESPSDESFGGLGSLRLEYRPAELTEITVEGRTAVQPSGSGFLEQRDSFDLEVAHRLAVDTFLNLTAFYQRNDEILSDDSGGDRHYFSVMPAVVWRFARNWDLSASYRHREQKAGDGAPWAKSNAVFLTLAYRTPNWVVSR